jgi:hypothetical protein
VRVSRVRGAGAGAGFVFDIVSPLIVDPQIGLDAAERSAAGRDTVSQSVSRRLQGLMIHSNERQEIDSILVRNFNFILVHFELGSLYYSSLRG